MPLELERRRRMRSLRNKCEDALVRIQRACAPSFEDTKKPLRPGTVGAALGVNSGRPSQRLELDLMTRWPSLGRHSGVHVKIAEVCAWSRQSGAPVNWDWIQAALSSVLAHSHPRADSALLEV
ncbi:hypothetical protein DFH11DRAFT_1731300 [Phellopilus nigrolimitatus]|nr:hypothetical protein DFH11DRAFT_1731300 [Phellopilus nigrolimitatus]